MSLHWNNLIRAYATSKGDLQKEAVQVFLVMRRSGCSPNEFTFPFLLKACASFFSLCLGRQVHGDVLKRGLGDSVYVQNALIHFYGSCKKIEEAHNVFDKMAFRTVVSWNSILSACKESLWYRGAIEIFFQMLNHKYLPDETTMVILLSACSEIGNSSFGKLIHSQVIVRGLILNCQLGTALLDMYGKCGMLDHARFIFHRMYERNVWTWSAMILGLALHGCAKEALQLFKKMKISLIEPNDVTFLGLLFACGHAGLVDAGRDFFRDMQHVYRIKPEMVHYGAMVDILGRAGCLEETYNFILSMPIEADAIIWRTLLSACHIHDVNDDSRIGEIARRKLLDLEPRRSGNLVLVANKYAKHGMWEKAAHLRKYMNDGGVKNRAGESCIEIDRPVF